MFAVTDKSAMYSLVVWRWITCTFTYIIVDLDFIFQWVIAYFVSNFVAVSELLSILSYISLPWQLGSVVAEFVWRHSIARSLTSTTKRKHLGDISHTSWVMAHFVSNFVAMTTSVGRGRIFVTTLNSRTAVSHRSVRQTMRFQPRMCLLGVRKFKFNN